MVSFTFEVLKTSVKANDIEIELFFNCTINQFQNRTVNNLALPEKIEILPQTIVDPSRAANKNYSECMSSPMPVEPDEPPVYKETCEDDKKNHCRADCLK